MLTAGASSTAGLSATGGSRLLQLVQVLAAGLSATGDTRLQLVQVLTAGTSAQPGTPAGESRGCRRHGTRASESS